MSGLIRANWEAIRNPAAAGVVFVCLFATLIAIVLPTRPSNASTTGSKTDILLLLDTSGSMDKALDEAVAKVNRVSTRLKHSLGDVAFGVAEVRDYGIPAFRGVKGDVPFKVVQPVTRDVTKVETALGSLKTRPPGGIASEAYARALNDALEDKGVGWRQDSRRMVIVVADDMPHDNNINQGIPKKLRLKNYRYRNLPDPGKDEEIGTADDIDWQTTLNRMSEGGLPIMYLLFEGRREYLPYWRIWAGRTGGAAVDATEENLGNKVVNVARRGAAAKLPDCPPGMSRGSDRRCRPVSEGCPDVLMVAVPGTGGDEASGSMSSAVESLGRRLKERAESEGSTFGLLELPVTLPGVVDEQTAGREARMVDGQRVLRDSLRDRAKACRKTATRIVLAGQGSGAELVGNELGAGSELSPSERKRIAAGILFSDPLANTADRPVIRGGYLDRGRGVLGQRELFSDSTPVFSFCRSGDAICGGAETGLAMDVEYARNESIWAANLVGNLLFGAVDELGYGIALGDSFRERNADGVLVKHVPLTIELSGPGTIQVRAQPGVNERVFESVSHFLKFRKAGKRTFDVALPVEGTRTEEARSVMRLPSQGPGLALSVDAIASAAGKLETRESILSPLGADR